MENLFDRIVEPDNLRKAFYKASKDKRHRREQREFAANLEYEITHIHNGLLSGDY